VYLAQDTPSHVAYDINGRQYVETQDTSGEWIGRGWIKIDGEPVEQKVPARSTLSSVICRQQMRNEGPGLPEAQHDAGIGFNLFLLPGALPTNSYNLTPYYACNGWLLGKQEQAGHPLHLVYDPQYPNISAMLQQATQTDTLETGLEVRRQQCPGGLVDRRVWKTMALEEPPECLVISVVRSELQQNRDLTVQELPVIPSERIMFFGTIYHLVTFGTKTGTRQEGHWTARVKTTSGWYNIDDEIVAPVPISSITNETNGVLFIYQRAEVPLLPIDEEGGLKNSNSKRCWANAFIQMIRYSAVFASRIGIVGRLPTVKELFCLIDGDGTSATGKRFK
jgi:hypothetical protein